MAWVYIFIAGLLEVAWAVGLKNSAGFTRLWPSVFTIILMIASFAVLAQGMRTLPMGTAYAVWTGIGVLGTVVIGIIWFNEPHNAPRLLFIAMILAGIIGLKITHVDAA